MSRCAAMLARCQHSAACKTVRCLRERLMCGGISLHPGFQEDLPGLEVATGRQFLGMQGQFMCMPKCMYIAAQMSSVTAALQG